MAVMAMQNFFQWCTKPPQAVVVVFLLVMLVLGTSFYAGRLKRELFGHPVPVANGTVHN